MESAITNTTTTCLFLFQKPLMKFLKDYPNKEKKKQWKTVNYGQKMHFLQIALQLFNVKNVKYVSIVFVILVAFQNSPHSIGCHKIFITYLNV